MRFLIISDLVHKVHDEKFFTYGPYVKEINLWLKYVDVVEIISPVRESSPNPIDLEYKHPDIYLNQVPAFNLLSWTSRIKTLFVVPLIIFKLFRAMKRADHIHLRCPNNMGLLGSVVQVFFRHKVKTAKYANNWDPNHPQPWSYKLQQKILSSEFLTKNINVLVYGEWKNQSKNIKPFFTATYNENEKQTVKPRSLTGMIKLVYVGHMGINKRPMLCAKVVKRLLELDYSVQLDMFGEGPELETLKRYIEQYDLHNIITLHGNKNATVVKKYFQEANFLILASKSEGWPKVVSEAMFWGIIPLVTRVSCVPYMLNYGQRGTLIEPTVESCIDAIKQYFDNPNMYTDESVKAYEWSQNFTLDKFELEIKKLLK